MITPFSEAAATLEEAERFLLGVGTDVLAVGARDLGGDLFGVFLLVVFDRLFKKLVLLLAFKAADDRLSVDAELELPGEVSQTAGA